MLKVMRDNLTFFVPQYWMNCFGVLRPTAVVALKVFFGELNNTQADELLCQLEKKDIKGGFTCL
jgi:hypothetical protein